MIISHKYKYIFVELDRTGSSAIAKEFCENYGGRPILWKRARYCDFLKIATPKEKKYFVFSGVRNPLDILVSIYFRYKYDHNKRFSRKRKGVTKYNSIQYNFIKDNRADFADFFKKFYTNNIYNEWKTKGFDSMDYIYRFESLQKDFSNILKILCIKQKRPLPIFNKTLYRKKDFIPYYPKDIQVRARMVFGKYMKKWGYKFPKDWVKPNIWQSVFVSTYLNIKYFLKKLYHLIIDSSYVYKTLYKRYIK